MKKSLTALLMTLALMAVCISACADSLFVDNRETDKIHPERLNLRAAPSKNGAILGLYYTGAEVENLGAENEEFVKVSIGGMNGYMAVEYLITAEEAAARYGEDGGFGVCRAAQIDLTGLWEKELPLLDGMQAQAKTLAMLESGEPVELVGILDPWAYIAADVDGTRTLGYVPLDALTDVGALKVSVIAGEHADSGTILYNAPNNKAEPIMTLKNGTACFSLFGRKEGEWRRVRVGGVSGWIKYTQTPNLHALGDQPRNVVPYYPLQMQTKGDALLYQGMEEGAAYMTLGREMNIELLAECGEYAYVRTMEGGAGAYDCGDFGYMRLADLSVAQAAGSIGVAQVDDGDLPLVLLASPDAQAEMIGALCSGAQVRIADYTQSDYIKVSLGKLTGYIPKDGVRIITDTNKNLSGKIPQRATLLADITLCDKPETKAAAGLTIAKGSRVYMLGVMGDWAYVQYAAQHGLSTEDSSADCTGFVPLDKLNAPASTTHLTAFANTDKVNLRDRASSQQGAIIGRSRTGERLRVADYGAEWTMVETPDGKCGYMMTKYLDFE